MDSLSCYQQSILDKLRDVIQPLLDNFGLKAFAYRRFLSDGRSFGVSTDSKWNKWHNQYLLESNAIPSYEEEVNEASINGQHACFRIGVPNQQDELCVKLYEFNMWNTLCLYKKEKDYVDGCYFVSTKENLNIVNIYINHIAMLEQHAHHFKRRLLQATQLNSIDQLSLPTIPKESFAVLPNFLEKKGFLSSGNDSFLISKREAECLYYIAQGETMKQIAKTLGLSPRTIETYVDNLKNKTGSRTKEELIHLYKNAHARQLALKYKIKYDKEE